VIRRPGAVPAASDRKAVVSFPGFVALLALVGALFAIAASSASAALPASFGTLGAGAGQISGEAQGIAVDQGTGDVYVADRNNNRIEKFGSEGQFLLAFGWGVADGTTEALQTCTTTCFAGLPGAGAGQFASAEGIAVDNSGGPSDGDVYVIDSGNGRVEKFGPAGNFILAFGEGGAGPGQFEGLHGRSISVGPTGIVYIADRNRVQRFSEAGGIESEVTIPGIGAPENFALDPAGNFYLAGTSIQGVHKYDTAGAEVGTPRDEAASNENFALAVAPAEALLVNDFRAGGIHHILGFDPSGAQISSFDPGESDTDGRRGIAYSDVTEALYILNAGRVRIVAPPAPGPYVLPGSESATEIRPTTATLNAIVNPEGGTETKCRFQYVDAGSFTAEGGFASPNTAETTPVELTGGAFEDQPISVPITGLTRRTIYHYRAVCENAAAEANPGPDQTFETLPPVSIDSTSVSDVTAESATLEASLNPQGLLSTYHFEYDTVPYAGGEGPHGTAVPFPAGSLGSGEADVSRSAQIQGLAPGTTYYFRVVAENELGAEAGPGVAFTTQTAAASLLPDGRIWEMVTPPNKHGSPLEPLTEEGGLIQAPATCTPDDCAFAEVALGPLNGEAAGVRSPSDSQWLSARGPGGWSTQDITTPHEEISVLHAGTPSEYKQFSADLSSSVVEPEGVTPLSPQTTERTPYRREADGEFTPLVTAANVPAGTKFGGNELEPGSGQWGNGVEFRTATPDLAHEVLVSPQHLAAGFGPGFEANGEPNLYELSAGALNLVSVLPSGEPTSEAGLTAKVGNNNVNMRGAISDDGNRVFFETTGSSHHLYLRANATEPQSVIAGDICTEPSKACTIQLDVAEEGLAAGAEGEEFQAASADGSRVFFTDTAALTANSTAKGAEPDLYMCEVSESEGHPTCSLTDLSVDPNPGESANVFGGQNAGFVSAVDADGTHVYFTADGVLTKVPNAEGEVAVPGICDNAGESTCNLYVYDTGTAEVELVAVLSNKDRPDWTPRLDQLTAGSSPDGHWFSFMSRRPLTGYDNRDAASGERDEEVFLYDALTGQLHCASCNPTGALPHGVFDKEGAFPGLLVDHAGSWGGAKGNTSNWLAATIPGWTSNGLAGSLALYQSRYLSNSGRLFFNSSDALVPQDTNGVMDVYEYEPPGVGSCTTSSTTYSPKSGGCVSLISSGTSPEESAFLDADEEGEDVFFLTQSKLASTDIDSAFDVYDAAVGGSTHETVKAVECSGDACQQPATPPVDATPGSLTFNGAGNVVQCPKGKVRQKGRCVKKHKAKKKKNRGQKKNKQGKKSQKRHARQKRGAGK
jgi:NHL repeat